MLKNQYQMTWQKHEHQRMVHTDLKVKDLPCTM